MSSAVEAASDIRPFQVDTPDGAVEDLRRRIAATQWPEKETVADESHGVPLVMVQKLARCWMADYDWRTCEAQLNALPQFITEIDGLDVSIPVATTVFPGEQYQAPCSWAEQAYPTLIYFNEVQEGGHFAAWEQPKLFSEGMRQRSGRLGR